MSESFIEKEAAEPWEELVDLIEAGDSAGVSGIIDSLSSDGIRRDTTEFAGTGYLLRVHF
jgi:hypothetical protein